MKKYLSVLRIFSRSTIVWMLLLLAAMAAGEYFFFQKELTVDYMSGFVFELVIEQSGIFWAFGIVFVLMTILLCLPGCEFGSKTGYTLRRLSVTEKTVFWLQSGYNFLCFLSLWGVQLCLILVFWNVYVQNVDPSVVGGQTLFLAFYRSEYLYSLLPLDNVSLWIRNLTFLLGLSICSAQFPFSQRRNKKLMFIVPMIILVLLMYPRELNQIARDITAISFSLSFAAFSLSCVYKKEDDDEA